MYTICTQETPSSFLYQQTKSAAEVLFHDLHFSGFYEYCIFQQRPMQTCFQPTWQSSLEYESVCKSYSHVNTFRFSVMLPFCRKGIGFCSATTKLLFCSVITDVWVVWCCVCFFFLVIFFWLPSNRKTGWQLFSLLAEAKIFTAVQQFLFHSFS